MLHAIVLETSYTWDSMASYAGGGTYQQTAFTSKATAHGPVTQVASRPFAAAVSHSIGTENVSSTSVGLPEHISLTLCCSLWERAQAFGVHTDSCVQQKPTCVQRQRQYGDPQHSKSLCHVKH